jgi:hypothetical protein
MRDKRFIAEHRGGLLTKEQHKQLIIWSCDCVEHILSHFDNIDERLKDALSIAKKWSNNDATVGEARKASVLAHTVAREMTNPISIAIARAVGHTVATAHMSDHSLGGALYALKVIKLSGKSVDEEKKWQEEHLNLPLELKELILTTRDKKGKALKILNIIVN